ncbi:MAG: tyrosine-type recombinase/integrase [Komarekiella atlantica HA4396-MV6]|nr:tyrosine-type recombinase/integrase [Komarekiella atlantica HA4396-MV6]
MTNSAKTPSGKTRKGQVAVRLDSGSIKACFPRNYCSEGKQIKLATGINPDNWESKASQLQRRLQIELEDGRLDDGNGNFDLGRYQEILGEYGLSARLRVVRDATTSDGQLPPKPELSILEVWDMYCEYKKDKDLAVTSYMNDFKGTYRRAIEQSIKDVGESPLEIHNWLLTNRCRKIAKLVLSHLSHAHKMAVRQKLLTNNPFDGLSEGIDIRERKKIINQNEDNEDSKILDSNKAFSWLEANEIMDFLKNSNKFSHWYNFVKFKFLTGCRTGEAIAFWWKDIKWADEHIIINRSYSLKSKLFKPTKNETVRLFPMPKGGELWNLLKSIPQGEPNECVFKSKAGKIINETVFYNAWIGRKLRQSGIITALIENGKLSKCLPPYNTRHTFVNHQINDVGIAPHVVNAWCEHSEEISKEHYRQLDLRVIPGYEIKDKQRTKSELDSLKEQLRQQQELINKLLQGREDT